jgi:putative endonuclease
MRKAKTAMEFMVYIVRCCDGTFYTGYTRDLKARVRLHNAGRGAKYTRARRPVRLIFHETFATQAEAMRRECEIKRLPRARKAELVKRRRKKPV